MHPVISIPFLGVALPATLVMTWVAATLGIVVGPIWIERLEGLDRHRVRRAMLASTVPVFVGGRLHFLLNQPHFFDGHPLWALAVWSGPMHTGGALLGALLSVPLLARWFRLPIGKLGDGLLPTVGLCFAIAKVGCFLAGCCYGTPCELPWCVAFPTGSPAFLLQAQNGVLPSGATTSLSVHPLELYLLASGLLVTVVALAVRRVKRYDGQVVWVVLVVQGLALAYLEGFRSNDLQREFWGTLPQLTWSALGLACIGALALLIGEVRRFQQSATARAGASSAVGR